MLQYTRIISFPDDVSPVGIGIESEISKAPFSECAFRWPTRPNFSGITLADKKSYRVNGRRTFLDNVVGCSSMQPFPNDFRDCLTAMTNHEAESESRECHVPTYEYGIVALR